MKGRFSVEKEEKHLKEVKHRTVQVRYSPAHRGSFSNPFLIDLRLLAAS
jgi:hypothetical protein